PTRNREELATIENGGLRRLIEQPLRRFFDQLAAGDPRGNAGRSVRIHLRSSQRSRAITRKQAGFPRTHYFARGTDGSNSAPSSGESGELRYCAASSFARPGNRGFESGSLQRRVVQTFDQTQSRPGHFPLGSIAKLRGKLTPCVANPITESKP